MDTPFSFVNIFGSFAIISSAGESEEFSKIALQRKIAKPGPIKLIAVPAIVWSACRLTQTTAWIRPSAAPARPPAKKPIQPLPVKYATAAPTNAPRVIIPSMPMFTTPERSLKQEPKAASSSGGVEISIALIKSPKFVSITSPPPSSWSSS